MSEMVERVARALAAEQGGKMLFRRDGETITWARLQGFPSGFAASDEGLAGFIDACWPKYRDAAVAVLSAMREPTEAMTDSGYGATDERSVDMREAWRLMIDEALK